MRYTLSLLACLVLLVGCGDGKAKSKKKVKESTSSTSKTKRVPEKPTAPAEKDPIDEEVRGLIGQLRSDSVRKRKSALAALAGLGDRARHRDIYDAVNDLITDGNWEVRSGAGITMLALRGTKGAPYVRPLLSDDNEDVRVVVINELGKLGPDYADQLADALSDDNADIQEIVFDHLARMKSDRAVTRAVTLYGSTDSEALRGQILRYLIACDSKAGCDVVMETVDDLGNPSAIVLALRYLGAKGEQKHVADVIRFLGDSEDAVKMEAAVVMRKRKVKTADTVANLIKLLEADSAQVRKAGHEALRAVTNQSFGFKPEESDLSKNAAAVAKWRTWFLDNEDKLPQG